MIIIPVYEGGDPLFDDQPIGDIVREWEAHADFERQRQETAVELIQSQLQEAAQQELDDLEEELSEKDEDGNPSGAGVNTFNQIMALRGAVQQIIETVTGMQWLMSQLLRKNSMNDLSQDTRLPGDAA